MRRFPPPIEEVVKPKLKWRCSFCGLFHRGEPSGKHQPVIQECIERVAKEPWQMTRAEFVAQGLGKTGPFPKENHHVQVKRALFEGKPVPPEVLKDYSDLAELELCPYCGANLKAWHEALPGNTHKHYNDQGEVIYER